MADARAARRRGDGRSRSTSDDPALQIRAVFQSAQRSLLVRGRSSGHGVDELRRGAGRSPSASTTRRFGSRRTCGWQRRSTTSAIVACGRGATADSARRCSGNSSSLRYEAPTTFQLALVRYHLGELDEAERLGLQARELLDGLARRYFQLQNLRTLALCAVARSELRARRGTAAGGAPARRRRLAAGSSSSSTGVSSTSFSVPAAPREAHEARHRGDQQRLGGRRLRPCGGSADRGDY